MVNRLPALPDEIVEHIQSLMDFKTAARSAVTCTRLRDSLGRIRHLDLDESLFGEVVDFWDGALKTLKRYRDSNLKLESLKLQLYSGVGSQFLSKEVLEDASKLGVHEIDICIYNPNLTFTIPGGVFSSQSLQKLSVQGGVLNISVDHPVRCTSIKTLALLPDRYMGYMGNLFNNYIMNSPSLESFECCGYLLWLDIANVGSRVHNLLSLSIENMHFIDNNFFVVVLRTFPRLRRLTVKEILNSDDDPRKDVVCVYDGPVLRKFNFDGAPWSSLTFDSGGSGFVSDVHVDCRVATHQWFACLRKLLEGLSSSKIHLTIKVKYQQPDFTPEYHVDGEAIEVQYLVLKTVGPTPVHLVDSLFRVFKPLQFLHQQKHIK